MEVKHQLLGRRGRARKVTLFSLFRMILALHEFGSVFAAQMIDEKYAGQRIGEANRHRRNMVTLVTKVRHIDLDMLVRGRSLLAGGLQV